ncbi:hypothetical protein ACFWCA_03260 [Streptomyces phaeochromogenes]
MRELEDFLAVVDPGGFNRAFALHVSQPPWDLTYCFAVCLQPR